MNAHDFYIGFSKYAKISQEKSKYYGRLMFKYIVDVLLEGENITIQDFGSFKRKLAKGHTIGDVNGEPGDKKVSQDKYRMSFSPSITVKKKFNPDAYPSVKRGRNNREV